MRGAVVIDGAVIAKLRRSQRSRSNNLAGEDAQFVVGHRLRMLGFLCVERIETGWKVQRTAGRITGARPLAKVAADWTAVGAGGRSIRCEVKRRIDPDDRLAYSDLEDHQRRQLTAHAAAGGLSLIAWVSRHGVAIIDWTRVSLKPGGSLLWAEVALYDLARRA